MTTCIITQPPKGAILPSGVVFRDVLKKIGKFQALLRGILVRVSSDNVKYFFDKTKLQEILAYDTIIVFDNIGFLYILNSLLKSKTNQRIILFLWNPICYWETMKGKAFVHKLPEVEIWTYDLQDSKKFGWHYAGQFYYRFPILKQDIKYDLYFVGINKGRFKILKSIEKTIGKSVKCHFRYVSKFKNIFNKKYSSYISYSQVLNEACASKCILEIVQKNQYSLTLRVMESIFLQKKLITNNSDIKKYNFYDENNIMILEESNIKDIEKFLAKPFIPYSTKVVECYSFDSWLERILKKNSFIDT
jgi:hypothetical protein